LRSHTVCVYTYIVNNNSTMMKPMTIGNAVHVLAGSMILLSVALTKWVNPQWFWFTVFIGANLLQSAFTGFCPAEIILRKLGVGRDKCCAS
jgi:hypothetical protein